MQNRIEARQKKNVPVPGWKCASQPRVEVCQPAHQPVPATPRGTCCWWPLLLRHPMQQVTCCASSPSCPLLTFLTSYCLSLSTFSSAFSASCSCVVICFALLLFPASPV
ncbi:hypothetical protein Pcinc_008140 [Petrolisthes cinctipes]|uniref:Uncharacterized protein n=1 Tax=Petrolisthes cinctipes TaxID=88211 RepID=A0AAE1KWR3_PETCI|nr:hypothetical protein Pcinc_008140 [Petrolisthes cinctipes]